MMARLRAGAFPEPSRWWPLVLAAMALSGCKNDDAAASASTSAGATASAATTAAATSASAYADADLAVAEDFAGPADSAISKENYKDKLAEMARELEQKPASASPDGSASPTPAAGSGGSAAKATAGAGGS